MKGRLASIVVVMLVLLGQAAPALAQQDLQGGIEDLVRQMIASMEQQQKRKLAILDFTKLDGSVDNFGRYLSERLITSMFLTKRFAVVERRQLNKILAELKLNLSDLIDPKNAKQLGKGYGVDAIATGSVTVLETSVEVNARLIETETGEVFSVATTRFTKDKDVAALVGGGPEAGPQLPEVPQPATPGAATSGMVLIPAGPFIYGEEGKEQKITLPAFSIDIYEVTNAEYAKVRPHEYPPDKANHPVANVSWHDADRYCKAVGKRLPTEQEWEKAARGTDGRHYPWGDMYDAKKVNAENRFGGTTAVGQFPAGRSRYGIFDMAGNVWEWTASEWGSGKVIRGGSWKSDPGALRSAYRTGGDPANRLNDRGFRCARSH